MECSKSQNCLDDYRGIVKLFESFNMEFIISIGEFLLKLAIGIFFLYVIYIIYFRDGPRFPDDDIDRLSKGGDH
jgi:hypothetical protein